MNPELINKVHKISEIADTFSEAAKAASISKKVNLFNSYINNFASDSHGVKSLGSNSIIYHYGGSMSLSIADVNSFVQKHQPIKLYGGGLGIPTLKSNYIDTFNVGKRLAHLDFLSEINLQEISIKKKIESKLIDSIKKFEVDSELTELYINFSDSHLNLKKCLDVLCSVVEVKLLENPVQKRPKILDLTNLHYILHSVCQEIDERQKFVDLIKSIKKAIFSIFRKFQINRRERFRKINSFIFKNLDDYHSLSLASEGY